jgi:hypothetical protein
MPCVFWEVDWWIVEGLTLSHTSEGISTPSYSTQLFTECFPRFIEIHRGFQMVHWKPSPLAMPHL